MEQKEIQRLKFRRQYVISPSKIECPFEHALTELNPQCFLYTHTDLQLSTYENANLCLYLLGDIFDYEVYSKNNHDILRDIAHGDYLNILSNLEKYSGNFVLIIKYDHKIILTHDATATKKIYHTQKDNVLWCSSQPHLLASITGIKKTSDPSRLAFYSSDEFEKLDRASIGDTTYYEEIHQLLPNHYLDLSSKKIDRYWPSRKRVESSLEECVEICATMIKGYILSIANRYDIMLPVTAGKDSRTLLAATFDIRNEVFYYLNKELQLKDRSNDVKIPRELFKRLELDFHFLDVDIAVDEDFKRIYYENNFLASDYYLPIIYNYYLNFSDKVNLPGNIATGGAWWFPAFEKKTEPKDLVRINKVGKYPHAWDTYSRWLDDSLDICRANNYNVYDLFYWEERMGNWGTQIQLDKEISQLEFNPLNSRLLVEIMLSVKPRYVIDFGNYRLNKGIIEKLWPEALSKPINPGWKNEFFRLLEFLGLSDLFHRIWYG